MPLSGPGKTTISRIARLLAFIIRGPRDFFTVRFRRGWSRNSTFFLVMQTKESRLHLELARGRLVTETDSQYPVHEVIEAGRNVIENFAEKVNSIPQSTYGEVLLGTTATSHILGGCNIGLDASTRVVDSNHEVFGYPGLYVIDGSVIPANLGVNPALAITAMAERAADRIPANDSS